MRIGVTGATGFLGRYIVRTLAAAGHTCRCWIRPESDRTGFEDVGASVEWLPGELGDAAASRALVAGCDAVVHAALFRPGRAFMGGEGDLGEFLRKNLLGTIELIESARAAGVGRFVFISTCAVYDKILEERPLDEAHPLWPKSHYGAHKAALEKFVHSYGLGHGYPICALRPVGIYGLAHPAQNSKWFDLVQSVVRGEDVTCTRGGKEVHAADVAQAVSLLLSSDGIAGEAYNCCDLYVPEFEVAMLARQFSKSRSQILGERTSPKHQIVTSKLESLGLRFGRRPQLGATIRQLVQAIQAQ